MGGGAEPESIYKGMTHGTGLHLVLHIHSYLETLTLSHLSFEIKHIKCLLYSIYCFRGGLASVAYQSVTRCM